MSGYTTTYQINQTKALFIFYKPILNFPLFHKNIWNDYVQVSQNKFLNSKQSVDHIKLIGTEAAEYWVHITVIQLNKGFVTSILLQWTVAFV